MILYDGYVYNYVRKSINKTFLWCVIRRCPGRLRTTDSMQVDDFATHDHLRDYSNCKAIWLQYCIKVRGLSTTEKPKEIIDRYINPSDINIIRKMQKYQDLPDSITRQRRKLEIDHGDMDYDIRENNTTKSGESFVFYNSEMVDSERFIIFGTDSSFIQMENSKYWLCDDTFRSCLQDFCQLYTIMGEIRSKMQFLIYILTKAKNLKNYDKIFKLISKKIKKTPNNIIIDFESAAFISLKNNFPGSHISGCLFHLSQIIWRRVQKESLTKIYKNDGNFRACTKILFAFSFIPKRLIPNMIIHFKGHISK
ncbi:hypothetical protein DMUE_0305 [Dictyocoela muelleri]|nr:hypothetical protein DMUE_0305 [Dictyocoela muelleri]